MKSILLKPIDWSFLTDIEVLDPDGWRSPFQHLEPKDFDEPISYDEFKLRAIPSTVQWNSKSQDRSFSLMAVYELMLEIRDLQSNIDYLLKLLQEYGMELEDNTFCFPDGRTWEIDL